VELATRHQLETVSTYNLSYRPFHIPQHKSWETNDSSDCTAASRHHIVISRLHTFSFFTWLVFEVLFFSFLRLFFWLRPCQQFSCVPSVFRSAATGSSSLLLGRFASSPLRVFGVSLAVALILVTQTAPLTQ